MSTQIRQARCTCDRNTVRQWSDTGDELRSRLSKPLDVCPHDLALLVAVTVPWLDTVKVWKRYASCNLFKASTFFILTDHATSPLVCYLTDNMLLQLCPSHSLLVDNIRSRLVRSALAPLMCSQFLRSATSGSTSMLTCTWGPTSQPSSERASRLYVRSRACGDLCHDMPCWPWFVHWLSARWTTATRFSLIFPASCRTGCSPSWMPPPVWFSQLGGQNA